MEHLLHLIDELPCRDKELLLHNLVRSGFEVVLWFEADGALRYVSDSCSSMVGCNSDALMEDPQLLVQMIHPEDRRLWRNHHTRSEHDEFLVRFKTPEGEYQPFEHRCMALRDEAGKYIGRIGILANVARRRAEFGDSTVLALGVEKNPLGMVITDAAGNIRYANSAYYANEMCFDSSSIVSDSFPLLTAASRATYTDMWHALDAGNSWQGRLQCPMHTDDPTWMFINVSPVLDDRGEVLRYVAIVEDITQRLAEEECQKEQNQKLQELLQRVERIKREWEKSFDCIDQVIAIVDEQNRLRRINNAITHLYGRKPVDLVQLSLEEVFPAELATAISKDNAGEFYDPNLDKWFNWRRFAFERSGEKVPWYIVTLHDVTELRRITSELSEAYATQKATQGKLVQQEKMASIGQLAAGVAHEINNPVGFVASNLNTLNKYVQHLCTHIATLEEGIASAADPVLQELVTTSRKQNKVRVVGQDVFDLIEESLEGTARVKNIVGNLKSFSRVGGNGKEWTDLHECIESSINIAWNEIKYHAQVERDFTSLPLVFCNAQQMNQVFLNLIVNAAQAIEQHGIITITARVDDPWVVVQISDTGCGIAPEHLEKIFDPFFTTKDVGKGTGLGLSLCYDMVQKHAGELKVKSVVGKGSTFEIRLPLYSPEGDGAEDSEGTKP
jgi:two-component system NtrC family sensor kinase